MDRVASGFDTGLQPCRSAEHVQEVVREATHSLGFCGYAYLRCGPGSGQTLKTQLLTNYPAAWRRQYIRRGYFRIDPVLRECADRITPICWHEVCQFPDVSDLGLAVFDDANRFGLRNGLSVPLHSPSGDFAVCSFVTGLNGAQGRRFLRHMMPTAHAFAIVLHDFVERVNLEGDIALPISSISSAEMMKNLK